MPELLEGLLPLGEPLIGAAVTLAGLVSTYLIGRKRSKQDLENLQAEKKSIEAASGVSTAEAASIISQAAAETVKPLLERIKEYRAENEELENTLLERETAIRSYKMDIEELRTDRAKMAVENKLMKERLRLLGESPPEIPSGGNQ